MIRNPILSIVAAFTALTLALLLYALSVILSEHKSYKSGSFYDILLTPKILSDISLLCLDVSLDVSLNVYLDEANYVYSSADGTKPTINTLTCYLDMDKLDKLLTENRFHSDDLLKDNPLSKRYIRGDIAIEIEAINPALQSKSPASTSLPFEPATQTTVVLFSY